MPNKFLITNDDAELDDVEFVVCVLASDNTEFTDNVRGVCSMCGVAVQWRPHAPAKPKKVCVHCALPMMQESRASGELHVIATPKTMDEITAFLRRQKQ